MDDEARQEVCEPVAVPATMADYLNGYRWARDNVGQSGGTVYRLQGRQNAPELFLKQGLGTVADDMTDEMVRLLWLADHVPVPGVVHFVRDPDQARLLMTAMPGRTAYQMLAAGADTSDEIVDALARFLGRLHAVPVDACPFNSDHRFRLTRARARIDANLVDVDDFDKEQEGWTAEDIWTEMQALLPLMPDPVVTHGDFSLDNLLIEKGEVTGCIDVGRAGIANRYQDLAVLWDCLGEFGQPLQSRFLHRYGIEEPDQRSLRFHLLLDELF